MENRGKTMLADKFDFGFAVDWMRKDLAICFDEARPTVQRYPRLPWSTSCMAAYRRVAVDAGTRPA